MLEPRVVVAHREGVWWLLSEAAQLEHMIMCQYLFAAFSLKQGTTKVSPPSRQRLSIGGARH